MGTEERVVGAEEGIVGSGQTGVMEAGEGVEGVGQGDVARARDGVFDSIKAPGAAEPDFSICIYSQLGDPCGPLPEFRISQRKVFHQCNIRENLQIARIIRCGVF